MRRLLQLFLLLYVFITADAFSQAGVDAVIPMDPSVRTGTLTNGMRYYVRRNTRPEKRAEFRLAVNAGSTAENDDQQGLAHVVEHMAFNGTRNFKKSEIVDYLESVGTKFGAHLNAYTSFDETVYMLQLPTDKPEIVSKGLQILEDWSYALSFDSIEVEKERGVVVEEWRLGQGANERMRRKYWPVLFKGSRYESRLPIGKKDIIEHCPQTILRDFYKDWYRPDLMAIVAVGDFDPDDMVSSIVRQFSDVPVASNPRTLKVWPVPDNEQMAIATVTDKEAQNAQIEIIYKQDVEGRSTVGDYRRSLAQELFSNMLSERLDELQRSSDPPFLYAGGDYGDLVRNKNAFTAFAISKEDGIDRALERLAIENERVRRYGFTEGELKRQKADMFSRMQKLYNEREMTESRSLATECVSNFLRQEPMPGIAYEFDLYKSYLDGITLSEVNAFAEKWFTDGRNCVVIITAPEKSTTVMPDSGRIRSLLSGMRSLRVAPYDDKVVTKPLVETAVLRPGKVASEKSVAELGVTEWRLSNGVRVVFKQTDFKDEVLFSAYSWGGWSNYGPDQFLSASVCDEIVRESGLGEFDATALGKALSGRIVRCSPFVSELQQGMNGSCAPKDLEILFQLIHKTFTEPRRDTAAFRSFIVKREAAVRNRGNDPQAVFSDTMTYAMSGYDYRFKPRTSDMMHGIDLDKSMAAYQDRFSDASGFTFFFVGAFSADSLRVFAETYLGSLPVSEKKSAYKDIGISSPKGNFERVVYKGTEPKSTVMMVFSMPFVFNRNNRNEVSALAKVLNIRLREVLREEKSGVYGVSCSANPKHYPNEKLEISIYFSCSPDNVEMLTQSALEVIKELRERGCDEKNLVKVKETAIRERQTSMKENQFWLSSISSNDQNKENLLDLLQYEAWVNSMTTADLKQFAVRYLSTENYARFVLRPER